MHRQAKCFSSQKNASERSSHSDTSGQVDQQKWDLCSTFAVEIRDRFSRYSRRFRGISVVPNDPNY